MNNFIIKDKIITEIKDTNNKPNNEDNTDDEDSDSDFEKEKNIEAAVTVVLNSDLTEEDVEQITA
jgi:hypothetical protein